MSTNNSNRISRKRSLLAGAGVVLLLGCAAIAALSLRTEPMLRTGQIEARQIDIASKIPGRIAALRCREGDRVEAGDVLFRLTDREVRARVAQAQGAVDAAHAQYAMARNGARPEQIAMAERARDAAQSQFALAEKTLRRMRSLLADSLIAQQEFDVVEQKHRAARAAMEAAEAQLAMARSGSRSEEKGMARGQYDRAAQTLAEAEAWLDESVITSPIDGVVGKRYADPGELVSTGYPVLSLIDLEDMWAELNLPETELRHLRVGDSIEGTVNGLGRELTFIVEHIAAMADFANWRAQDDRGTFEVRSFSVILRPARRQPDLRPGMTVTFALDAR